MTSIRNTPIADRSAIVIVALLTAVFAFIAYQPWRLYFFGDTWDILCEFHENGWTTIWRMHNEHFMPVSKAVLYVQYALFGMHNLPYQAVSIAIHSLNAALLYIAAGQLTGMVIPRLFGALFFGFSGVYWELTMWEAGQQTTLAMLFILLSLILGRQYLRQGKAAPLAGAMASALFATWSMGYGLLASPLLAVEAIISLLSGRRQWKRAAAVCLLPTLTILVAFGVMLRTDPTGFGNARRAATLRQALQVLPWTAAALRGLAASYLAPLSAPLVLGGLLLLAGFFLGHSFVSPSRLLILLPPISMLLLPYALTVVGRANSGIGLAASSRYQYLAAAALGLMLAWIASGIFEIAQARYPKMLFPLALALLLTLPLHAAAGYLYIRRNSPMVQWGVQARRFVSLAIDRHTWAGVTPSNTCIRPNLYLPTAMYPYPFFYLERALPLFGGANIPAAPVESLLSSGDLAPSNLLRGVLTEARIQRPAAVLSSLRRLALTRRGPILSRLL